ncbi:MAG: flavin reductase family protein [Burkholderiaceae bacterium]|nr:flavin reductase family protein [Burkholderiaceae bacterium]
MRETSYQELLPKALEQLPGGAFLTVKAGDQVNTMTIGWASFGHIWSKPVCCVLVRYSRYTYELLEKAADFSVSFPLGGKLRQALHIAGSTSGRDGDKFARAAITPVPGIKIISPYVDDCDLVYECKIVYKLPMDENALEPMIQANLYRQGDYHVMYFGEIVGAYMK